MKKTLGVILVCVSFGISGAFAASTVYPTSAEFLKAEGSTCKQATDGCNRVGIVNGQLGAMTMMYCEDIYGEKGQEAWTCLDQKNEDETLGFFSDNDRNYYITLQTQISEKNRLRVINLIEVYGSKILERLSWNTEKSVKVIEKTIIAFETAISKLSMQTPADAAMSEADSNTYQILNYAKFELQIIMQRWMRNAGIE